MSDEKRSSFDATWLTFGMPIGIVVGIAIGMAGFGNLLAGAVLGVVIGVVIGVTMGFRNGRGEVSEEDIEDDLARAQGLYGTPSAPAAPDSASDKGFPESSPDDTHPQPSSPSPDAE
ncbi:hypothetical protein ACXET9_13195 [Brachybacterium sp. DNPG3]